MNHPATPQWKTELPAIMLVAVSFLLGFYFYAHFPEQVPSHWNITGDVDDYSSRAFGAWFVPCLTLTIYLLLFLLPYIDPKHGHYAGFRESYHGIKTSIVAFMFIVYVFLGLSGMGYDIPMAAVIPIGVGLLFIALGYFIKSVKQNWAMGVRTPWTMENPVVWKKTNELMARLMMLAGVLIAACAFPFEDIVKAIVFFTALALIAIVPIVYSYFIYRQEEKNK